MTGAVYFQFPTLLSACFDTVHYSLFPFQYFSFQLYNDQRLTMESDSVYEPIPHGRDSNHIRILKVHPAVGTDEPIRGDLQIINLSSKPVPRFYSLSYVWG